MISSHLKALNWGEVSTSKVSFNCGETSSKNDRIVVVGLIEGEVEGTLVGFSDGDADGNVEGSCDWLGDSETSIVLVSLSVVAKIIVTIIELFIGLISAIIFYKNLKEDDENI